MTKPIPKGATEPLIAALLTRLPRPDTQWPQADRIAWLKMLAGAFDVVYGAELEIAIGARTEAVLSVTTDSPAPPRPQARANVAPAPKPEHVKAGCDYYVDNEGYVRCDVQMMDEGPDGTPIPVPTPGRRVLPDEAMGSQIYEYRGARRDRETMIWADDSLGTQGGTFEICGPG